MNWIKIITINTAVLLILIVLLELFSGLGRVIVGKQFFAPDFLSNADPCIEMRTDVLLSHIPNHEGRCKIKNGFADGEYVRYNVSDTENPVLLTLGGSTTAGFFQHISDGDTYPSFLAQILSNKYQVLNGGVGGYSSLQELLKVVRDAPRIRNLHTVVSLNGINETPNYFGPNEIRRINYPFLTSTQELMNSRQYWIDQRQHLSAYSFIPNLYSLFVYLGYAQADSRKTIPDSNLSDPIAFDAADRWLQNVIRINAILQTQGVRYYVFLQPTMGLEGPQSTPTTNSEDEKLFKKYMTESYINEIRSLFTQLKIKCATLDYCFDISDEAPPAGNFYNDPRHHNSHGNKVLAQIIADRLRGQAAF